MNKYFVLGAVLLAFIYIPISSSMAEQTRENPKTLNVLGTPIESCCIDPMTGYYRDGFCKTGADDYGTHIVCAEMTDAFLSYSRSRGNDLVTARPEYHFPGLVAGDQWCLCITRWMEAERAGVAPPVRLEATNQRALDYVNLETLKKHQLGGK